MQADLRAALDAFDRVLAAADGLVDPATLEPVASTVRSVRDRAGYLGDTVLAAVAGGTGSGKSSLVNALAGEVVTESGGMRPTTGAPVAWIPANPEPGLVRFLDDLGIDDRVGQDLHGWLALIDLPDTDSVVVDHRHTVQALLPRIDLVLWVIDPEKYQDRLLHADYLRPLASYHRQFLFVLNQIDRLDPSSIDDLVEDLRANLLADGIPDPYIATVAADPPLGPPIGIEELVTRLENTVDVKRTVYDKLTTDLTRSAAVLAESPDLSGGVGFEPRWAEAVSEAAESLAAGDRRASVARLTVFVDGLSDEVGGGAARTLRQELDGAVVESAVEVAYESSGAYRPPDPPPPPRWAGPIRWGAVAVAIAALVWGADAVRQGGGLLWPVILLLGAVAVWVGIGSWSARIRAAAAVRRDVERREALIEPISRQLESQLGRRLRTILRRRAGASAAATELNLALAELQRRLGS